MKNIEIYDPAMCCSTGVCGPGIDPELMRVATLINSLAKQGVVVSRHNLSNEPKAFVTNKVVNDLLIQEGAEALPITLLDGEVVKTKQYPTNQEFSQWLGVQVDADPQKKVRGCGCSGGRCC